MSTSFFSIFGSRAIQKPKSILSPTISCSLQAVERERGKERERRAPAQTMQPPELHIDVSSACWDSLEFALYVHDAPTLPFDELPMDMRIELVANAALPPGLASGVPPDEDGGSVSVCGEGAAPHTPCSKRSKGGEGDFHDDWTLGDELGRGAAAIVRTAHRAARPGGGAGSEVAVKVLEKDKFDLGRLRSEVHALEVLNHQNIIRLVSTYESPSRLYILMEHAKGGELFDRIVERGHFDEATAQRVMVQLVEALLYMHSRGFIVSVLQ